MPYTINQTNNVLNIAERQYGTGHEIKFTKFTSCIGVVGAVNGNQNARGVHLSISDGTSLFDGGAVQQVTAIFVGATQIKILGQIAYWTNPANGVAAAYAQLVQALGVQPDDIYQLDDGVYGAEIDNGVLELTFG